MPGPVPNHTRASLGSLEGAVAARLQALDRDQVGFRLWRKDATLFKDDAAHQAVVKNRLGWLTSLETMRKDVAALEAFAAEVRKAGFRHALLLGMGGSSLCPEVLRLTFGVAEGFLDLRVLDSTDPAAVRDAERSLDLAHTLFLVASKSGGTIEVSSLYAHFWSLVPRGEQYVAITDPGTSLEKLARERGFRRTFVNAPDIGGRYSALTYFGLVPAVLLGINLDWFLRDAEWMASGCGSEVYAKNNPGLWLGAVMAEAARAGRDKLTLIQSPEICALGSWIEQLVAESTGKEGWGVLPVDGESVGATEVYGPDRLFVYLRLDESKTASELDAHVATLERAGHPVVYITLKNRNDVAGEFFRWELATATAGAIQRINPFDEPNVKENKDLTGEILAQAKASGRPPEDVALAEGEGLRLSGDAGLGSPASVAAGLAAHLQRVKPGDFVAFLPYLHRTPDLEREFVTMRDAVRARRRVATTLGFGPRFLHSTGQLHKGGMNSGVFVQVTCDDPEDLPIPGAGYTFGTLKRSQAMGDLRVLIQRQRRVLRVHLCGPVGPTLARFRELLVAAL